MFRRRKREEADKNSRLFKLSTEMNVYKNEDDFEIVPEKSLENRAEILFNHPDNERNAVKNSSAKKIEENSHNVSEKRNVRLGYNHTEVQKPADLDKINKKSANFAGLKKPDIPNKIINVIDKYDGTRLTADMLFDASIIYTPEYLKKYAAKYMGLEASENFAMEYTYQHLNTPYAKQFKVYESVEQLEDVYLRNYMRMKLSKEVGISSARKVRGILIDEKSSSSRVLSNNSDIIRILSRSDVRESILNGKLTDNYDLKFTDKNFKYALGKADIVKARLLNTGEIDLYICDYYNFNGNERKFLIEGPRMLELQGFLTPYFIIYHVIIPSNKVKSIFGSYKL